MASKKLSPAMALVKRTRDLKGKAGVKVKVSKVTNPDNVIVRCKVFASDAFQFDTEYEGNVIQCVPMHRINKLLEV